MKEKNITEIINNKKYRIDIEKGRKYDGTRNRIVKYATTIKEAREIRDNLLYEIRHEKLKPNSSITFYEFVKIWLKEYAERNVKPSTLYGYRCNLNAYILPIFKDYKMNEIKSFHLDKFYNQLNDRTKKGLNERGEKEKISSTTIQKQHRLISLIFNTAIKWDFVDTNPCSKVVRPPTKANPEMDFYNEQEITEIFKLLKNEDIAFKTAITMLITGGFRRAELLGLHWDDIDFEDLTISIKRNLVNIRGKGVIEDTTKTVKSVRRIAMPLIVFDLLNEYKEHQKQLRNICEVNWKDTPYVFKSSNGNYIYPETISSHWKQFLKKNKLRAIRLHDLRHTCATFLISNGIPIATVSKKLGHSNIYTTLNTYTHSVNDDEKTTIDLMNEKLFK